MPDDVRRGLAKLAGQVADGVCACLGLLLGPLRRILLHEIPKDIEVLHPIGHELLVVQIFIYDDIDDGQIEGIVGTRTDEIKIVGLGGRYIGADINDRELAAIVHAGQQVVDLGHVDGLEDIALLQDYVPGVTVVV